MPRHRPQRGIQPEIINRIGALPLGADQDPRRTTIETLNAYSEGGRTSSNNDLLMIKFMQAGLEANGVGGPINWRFEGAPTKGRPASFYSRRLYDRFLRFVKGEGPLTVGELRSARDFVFLGLEACGFASRPVPKRGRPIRERSIASVPYLLARYYREIESGIYTRADILNLAAKIEVLKKISKNIKSLDINVRSITIGPENECDFADALHRLEVEYYRTPGLTKEQGRQYRNVLAWYFRKVLHVRETKPELFKATEGEAGTLRFWKIMNLRPESRRVPTRAQLVAAPHTQRNL